MATRGSGGIPLIAYVAVGTLALLYFKSSLGLIGLAYLIKTNPLPVAFVLAILGIAGLGR